MMTTMDPTPHLDDAELARLLDREHSPAERARWEAHVAQCAPCSAEVDRLRADADVVREWLERAAFEVPLPHDAAPRNAPPHRAPSRVAASRHTPRRHATPWLRAAAAIALVALPVTAIAAIPAVRGWVVAAIAELRGTDDVAITTSPAAADAMNVDRIRFVPAAGNFMVRFDAAQVDGTLRIAYGPDAAAVLDRGGTEAVVAEDSLRLRNTIASTSSYVLQLPSSVTSVTVRIGARTIAVLDADALRTGTELPVR